MRKPADLEYAYIDFDGFFASVEEQDNPALHGKPVGVVPFDNTMRTCVIAANYKAKAMGVKTGTSVGDARRLCPGIALVPQSPDKYVRMHKILKRTIEQEIPIIQVGSIDEVTVKLDDRDRTDPVRLAKAIKRRIKDTVGNYITCSIGFGPNHLLAKTASDMDKPDGITILHPDMLPGPLLDLGLKDIPYIAKGIFRRLGYAGINTVEDLWYSDAKHMRAVWGSVDGERMWYALHGYEEIKDTTQRRMFGHGRVLPPEWRRMDKALDCARLLLTKAGRRMRREKFLAGRVGLSLRMKEDRWSADTYLGYTDDDHSALTGLFKLWKQAQRELPTHVPIIQLYVFLADLMPVADRQYDLFQQNNADQARWTRLTHEIDAINRKNKQTLVSIGPWVQPPGGYAGGKIAFTRIPDEDDFW